MKNILFVLIFVVLSVSGFGQTRNVLVGTNNAVVQPTNFWSADASNARSGLGLGSAATNTASAFQPASSTLSNIVSGEALTFTNITVGISNVAGLQSALDGKLSTNPTLAIANISNLQTSLDSKLSTNTTLQISNIFGLQTTLDGKLSGSFPIAISNVSGLQASLDGKLSTNPTLEIANISGLQTNIDSKLSITGNAINLTNFPLSLLRSTGDASGLTNFPSFLLRSTGDASGLTNFPALNQNTTGTASNVTGVVAITNGGTGQNTASGARSSLGLGSAATNPESAFQPSSTILSNLSSSNGNSLTNIAASSIVGTVGLASNITGSVATASNVTGLVALTNGGTGATNAATARTNLGIGSSDVFVGLTNLGSEGYLGFSSSPYILGSTNFTAPNNSVSALDSTTVRTMIGALATNGNASGLTNFPIVSLASNITGIIAISNGGSGGTTAGGARTNFGITWSALTNTNSDTFQNAMFGNGTNPVLSTNGIVVSPTNFWQNLPPSAISNGFQNFTFDASSATNNATNLPNLLIYSISPNVTNITNTIILPINGNAGNKATVIHTGTTNSVTAVRQSGSGTNLITFNKTQESISFIYNGTNWSTFASPSFVNPIYFSGANSEYNSAISRTNIGLGWSALTNTNAANALLGFNTATGQVVADTGTNVLTFTNGIHAARISTDLINSVDGDAFILDENPRGMWGDWTIYGALGWNNTTNAATTRANLGFSTNLSTLWTATNAAAARSAVGLGNTNDAQFKSVSVFDAGEELYLRTYELNASSYGDRISFEENMMASSGDRWLFSFANTVFDSGPIWVNGPIYFSSDWDSFSGNNTTNAAITRTNLGLGLPALTNTSNVTTMRALAGSTNTNTPYSGTISVTGTNNTNTLIFSNGILQSVTTP